eukprot:scaffold628818_cov34-Prasinocladus_malaysianus.AAC.1
MTCVMHLADERGRLNGGSFDLCIYSEAIAYVRKVGSSFIFANLAKSGPTDTSVPEHTRVLTMQIIGVLGGTLEPSDISELIRHDDK